MRALVRRLPKGCTCCLALVAGLGASGCEAYRELFPFLADAGDASVPGTPVDLTWGAWAASLDVPACPTDAVLVVTSAADDPLDGGVAPAVLPDAGARLTFREAVRIAERHPDAETILFDEAVFPAEAPTTIHLAGQPFPIAPSTMCIDARQRGVVLDFGAGLGDQVGAMLRVGAGSRIVGLTLLHLPFEFELGAGVQLAGCRIATDGHALFVRELGRFWQVEGYSGRRIGPGNVIAGDLFGVRHMSTNVTIDGNWFGVDVLTRKLVGEGTAIDLSPVGAREGNVVAGNVFATPTAIRATSGAAILRDNLVGIDRDGYRFPRASITMGDFSDFGGVGATQGYVIGPGNVVRGAAVGLTISGVPVVTVTRNSISEGGVPLSWPAKPFEAPTLTAVSGSSVSGTCPVDGTVELFSGGGSGPETFLADGACTGGTFSIPIAEAPGRFVSASLTDAQGHTSEFSAQMVVP